MIYLIVLKSKLKLRSVTILLMSHTKCNELFQMLQTVTVAASSSSSNQLLLTTICCYFESSYNDLLRFFLSIKLFKYVNEIPKQKSTCKMYKYKCIFMQFYLSNWLFIMYVKIFGKNVSVYLYVSRCVCVCVLNKFYYCL